MDVIVVGGGVAGMMAAISAAQNNHNVTLIERNTSLGRKLLITGNRRCNITNNKSTQQLVKILNNGNFMHSTFSNYDVSTIIDFFSSYDLVLKEEDHNRMFPSTNRSVDILNVFVKAMKASNVKILQNTKIVDLIVSDQKVLGVKTEEKDLLADHVIMATGGLSFPKLGSDGLGHQILQSHNVNITELYPTEAALMSHDSIITSHKLVGLSYKDVTLKVINNNKKIVFEDCGDILFTHKGLSGPLALMSSETVYKTLLDQKYVDVSLTFVNKNEDEFMNQLSNNQNVTLKRFLNDFVSARHTDYIIETLQVESTIILSQVSNIKRSELLDMLYRFTIKFHGVSDIKKAFVTGGGVDLLEINPSNFNHKHFSNLSICGELLDLHGPIGGYNLTIAFLSGLMAGSKL